MRWPINLVRVAAILVLIAACSGIASTLVASNGSIVCVGCGPNCDAGAAPRGVLEAPLGIGLAFLVVVDDPGFEIDTRPLDAIGDSVFHPPRFAA